MYLLKYMVLPYYYTASLAEDDLVLDEIGLRNTGDKWKFSFDQVPFQESILL